MMGALALVSTWDAKWRPLYNHVKALDYGTLVTSEELVEITGRPDREGYQAMARRVDLELQRHDQKAFVNVRTIGYQVILPNEHVGLAHRRRRRSKRQTGRGSLAARSANFDYLSPEEIRAAKEMARWMGAVEAQLQYHNARIARNEKELRNVVEETDRRIDVATDEATQAATKAALERVEKRLRDLGLTDDG